jgi:hypothetical protein
LGVGDVGEDFALEELGEDTRLAPQEGQSPRLLQEPSRARDSSCYLDLRTIWSFNRLETIVKHRFSVSACWRQLNSCR